MKLLIYTKLKNSLLRHNILELFTGFNFFMVWKAVLHFFLNLMVRVDIDERVISPVLTYHVLFYLQISAMVGANVARGFFVSLIRQRLSTGSTLLCLLLARELDHQENKTSLQ